jgi:glycerol-3-phosphate dehydrogenase
MPTEQTRRYARLYGTRARDLLGAATKPDDLGHCFGADLYAREIDFLMDTEWARSADDIVWRRTKLGLRLSPAEIDGVAAYVASRGAPHIL